MSAPGDEEAQREAADGESAAFGSCCSELGEVLAGDGFDPFMSVGDNGVIYMTVGVVDQDQPAAGLDDGGGAALIEHPMFFCPFCGTALQTRADVKQKMTDGDS